MHNEKDRDFFADAVYGFFAYRLQPGNSIIK